MGKLKSRVKSFDISKREVWESWCEVRANRGAPGVDRQSVEEFEKDLRNNLYKIWNRMSSGTLRLPEISSVQVKQRVDTRG